jgi:hypothetical protein
MEEQKLCKNCKHFKRHKDSCQSIKFGHCVCSKFVYGSAYEQTKKEDNDFSDEANELLYEDYEGYNADFEVGENFGCIHWEAKEMLED